MMPVSSDLLNRWLSFDLDVSQQAFKEIKSLGKGALPVLRVAISTGSSKQLAACRLVLEMDESDVRELVLPLFARGEIMVDLLSVIAGAKVGLPCVWPSLTGTLRESDRIVRLRALDAIQSQITRAKIEELCLDDWAEELICPMAGLVAEHDFYVRVKAAELISRLPLKSEAIALALEASVPQVLDEKQAGLSYFAKALMAQDLSDETKANALGDIMRRGIYGHDRFVAALCAGELGVSGGSCFRARSMTAFLLVDRPVRS